jgi:signal transduction histidine kinase
VPAELNFFAYDDQGTNIVHGFLPEREGKNFISTKDTKGYAYLVDMIKLAKSGGGHIYYGIVSQDCWFLAPIP